MKKIEAYIRPEKVGAVRRALEKLGVPGLTLYQVDGHGRQRGVVQKFGGEEFRVGILPKTKIEVFAADPEVEAIADAIVEAAWTGEFGDGKIIVTPVEQVIRIRTKEKNEAALIAGGVK